MSIEVSFTILEDGTRKKKAGEQVYEGSPLALDSTGELKLAADSDKVYGLSKLDSNSFRDFSFGEFGAYGSGQLTAVVSGIVRVNKSVFNQIEVDTSTTTTSSPTTVKLFDDTKTYAPGQPLYVDAAGLITNAPSNNASLMGRCTATPLQTGDGSLELELTPMASTVAADLA
jgi:hypothetical protein